MEERESGAPVPNEGAEVAPSAPSLEDTIIAYVLETPNNVNPAIIKAIFQKFNKPKAADELKA